MDFHQISKSSHAYAWNNHKLWWSSTDLHHLHSRHQKASWLLILWLVTGKDTLDGCPKAHIVRLVFYSSIYHHDSRVCSQRLSQQHRTCTLLLHSNATEQCWKGWQTTSLDSALEQSHRQVPSSHAEAWYAPSSFVLFLLEGDGGASGFNWILCLLLHNVVSFNGPEEWIPKMILHAPCPFPLASSVYVLETFHSRLVLHWLLFL